MLGPPSLNTLAVGQHRPEFAARIQNITVNVGREAVLECHVNHLGRYKVRCLSLSMPYGNYQFVSWKSNKRK